MELSSSEDEESSNKTYASTYSSDQGLVCKCSIPCQCSKLGIPTPIKYLRTAGLSKHVLDTVPRTESYLKQRRIPELMHFLLTKLLADCSDKPLEHLVNIFDDCMLFRAGLGNLPGLYEERHLKAVVKSFDPGHRGWVNAGQLRRIYITLGLNPPKIPDDDIISTTELLKNLKKDQEYKLSEILKASAIPEDSSDFADFRENNTPIS